MDNNSKVNKLKHFLNDSKSELSEEETSHVAKKAKVDPDISNESSIKFKNPLQQLYEIKAVQPLNYELVAEEGLGHQKTFTYHLKFKLNEEIICFMGKGSSKKTAQRSAATNALYYIIRLPNSILGSFEIFYINSLLTFELKSLNINMNIEQYFSLEENGPINLKKSIEINNCKPISQQHDLILIDSNNNSNQELNNNAKIINKKTQEIIATKNSMSILNHLIQSDKFYFDENQIENIFKAKLIIDKTALKFFKKNFENLEQTQTSFIFNGCGNSKKLAKSKAAQLALECLFDINLRPPETDLVLNEHVKFNSIGNFQDFADNISEMVRIKYTDLLIKIEKNKIDKELIGQNTTDDLMINTNLEDLNLSNQNKFRNVYAGIVQTNDFDLKSAKLICLATGTKCVGGLNMSLMGKSLNDCHAEILAIRLMRKYLYKKLSELLNSLKNCKNKQELIEKTMGDELTIFELSNESKKFKLKSNYKYHLFISSSPCGDARIFARNEKTITDNELDNHPNRKARGLLRAKIECGEGTIPFYDEIKFQTWDGIMNGERLKVMSCSDKLCKYNILGIQGALLSNFLETIYLDSIIVGCFYHKEHMVRAMYDRVSKSMSDLPNGFRVNKPFMCSITNNLSRNLSKSSNKSLLWSMNLKNEIEIINCNEGKQIEGSSSQICKHELFKDWLDVCLLFNELQIKEIVNLSNLNGIKNKKINDLVYNDVKIMAEDYQLSKLKLYDAFKSKNLGHWISMPLEQDQFGIC